jgi:hypothetical protein
VPSATSVAKSVKRLEYYQESSVCGPGSNYIPLYEASCEICRVRLDTGKRFTILFKDLQWSAKDDCIFCKMILDALGRCGVIDKGIISICVDDGCAEAVKSGHTERQEKRNKVTLEFFHLLGNHNHLLT